MEKTFIVPAKTLFKILEFAEYQDWDVVESMVHELETLTYCENCTRFFSRINDYAVPRQCLITNYECDPDHYCGWSKKRVD